MRKETVVLVDNQPVPASGYNQVDLPDCSDVSALVVYFGVANISKGGCEWWLWANDNGALIQLSHQYTGYQTYEAAGLVSHVRFVLDPAPDQNYSIGYNFDQDLPVSAGATFSVKVVRTYL